MNTSPYVYCANNPISFFDVDGRWYDEKNEKRAARMERRANKRANRLDKKADKLDSKGKDIGDLRARSSELRASANDIRDMRSNTKTEFRFAKTNDKSNKVTDPNGKGLPVTAKTGENQITMFMNSFNNYHEPRHGGQIARGEFSIESIWGNPSSSYGAQEEVSAYRAQYAFNGNFNYMPKINLSNQQNLTNLLKNGVNSFMQNINNINQITPTLLKNMYDTQGINQQPIYPDKILFPAWWNN